MAKILVVDDERSIRNTLMDILESENHEVVVAANGEVALEKAANESFDLVFSDIKMPKVDGIEVLESMKKLHPETKMILISGHGNIETAVECIKKGAFDFIEKPIEFDRLLTVVKDALSASSQHADKVQKAISSEPIKKPASNSTVSASGVSSSQKESNLIASSHPMIGESPVMNHLKAIISRVAPTDARVLITGENGTGKEVVARSIFENSNRKNMPFVEVNCAAIPSELIESELFGHEKGSFTSAVKQRIGKFEQADGGTLFLDEVGDMSLSAQTKVLRVLQENELTRVGGDKSFKVNVRVIAATNKDLKKEISLGNFREDLYHRLNVIPIHVPPLRERRSDIPILINHFIKQMTPEGEPLKEVTQEAVEALMNMEWTGNIRELRNVIERLLILCPSEITAQDVEMFTSASFL